MNGRGSSTFRGGDRRRGGSSDRGSSRGGRGRGGRSDSRGGDRGRGRGGFRNDRNQDRGGIGKRRPQEMSASRPRAPQDDGNRGHSQDHNGQEKPFNNKKNFNKEGNNKQNLTTLSESILNKQTVNEDKEKFIERSLLIIDEYGIDNVIAKSSGSRLVQACLKYGNNTSKELIFLKIMKSDVDKILTDNFGKYIVKKIMVHVKDKKLLQIFNNYIDANFDNLLANPNGKIALSDYIECLPEFRAIEILSARFKKGPTEEEARTRVQEIVENKTSNNSIEQFWMWQHWEKIPEESKKAIVEELKENLDMILETKIHGIMLYCKIFDFVDLKDKTKMLKKCVAKKLDEIIKKNQNILFLLVKIVNSYDDSGNIATILYNDVLNNFYGFVENQVTATFLFYVLCEDFEKEFSVKYHPKLVASIKEDLMINTGKKPIPRKLEEARLKLFTTETFRELLKPEFVLKWYDSTFICVLISMILAYFIKSEQSKEGIQEFVDLVVSNTRENLENAESVELNKTLLLSHPFTHRMVNCVLPKIKKFIQAFSSGTNEYKVELEAMIEDLVRLMIENLSALLQTRAVFICIALVENTSYAEWISRKVKALPEYEELTTSKDSGLKILMKLVGSY